MAGLLWLAWPELGLPLDSLPRIRTWKVDRSDSHGTQFAGHTADSRSFGTAINHVKAHLVRNIFDTCRDDAIEGSSG
jgi:hypothetical protein